MGSGPQHVADAGKALKKTLRECLGNACECLASKINEYINANKSGGSGTRGLASRFSQQVQSGASGPGTASWTNHANEIQIQQRTLQEHLDEYDGRGCGGPPGQGIPADARQWATRPLPTAAEWGANNPAPSRYTGVTGSAAGDVVAAGAALGTGYLIYRGIRMLPSLFPPLWWTIPANAAIP